MVRRYGRNNLYQKRGVDWQPSNDLGVYVKGVGGRESVTKDKYIDVPCCRSAVWGIVMLVDRMTVVQ